MTGELTDNEGTTEWISACRRKITLIWWTGGAVLIALMLYLGGRPAAAQLVESASDPLGWIFPHLIPAMTLTGGVAYFGGKPEISGTRRNDGQFLFRLAAGSSIFYLLVLLAAIMIATGRIGPEGTLMALLGQWNIPLGVLQGVALSTIGLFFVKN